MKREFLFRLLYAHFGCVFPVIVPSVSVNRNQCALYMQQMTYETKMEKPCSYKNRDAKEKEKKIPWA